MNRRNLVICAAIVVIGLFIGGRLMAAEDVTPRAGDPPYIISLMTGVSLAETVNTVKPVSFADVAFRPGAWVCADEDGLIVADSPL